jgi:hypothetical protein
MQTKTIHLSPNLLGISAIIAPILSAVSTFYWQNGEYGVMGGTILTLAMIFWVLAFVALFGLLQNRLPWYSSIGLILAIYGCIGGICFGLVGVFSEAFQIDHETYLATIAQYALGFNLLLFWPGPLFPLSLLVLGVVLFNKKALPLWVSILLVLGAIAFPLSRIPRIEMIAHVSDVLLAIPLFFVGYQYLKSEPTEAVSA